MKHALFVLIGLSALGASACDDGVQSSLTNGGGGAGRGGASSGDDAADAALPTQPPAKTAAQVKAVSSPEVNARLHSCGKLTVSSIGKLLESRGLTGNGQRPDGAMSGKAIFDADDTPSVLGGPNYRGRVPEAPFASTAAVSKMFDIFTMSSYDAVAADWTAPACPDVKILGADGKFTKDGISCLIGKPATDEHVAIANDAIAKNPTDGAKIAIAALLSAAHTCQ